MKEEDEENEKNAHSLQEKESKHIVHALALLVHVQLSNNNLHNLNSFFFFSHLIKYLTVLMDVDNVFCCCYGKNVSFNLGKEESHEMHFLH